MVHLVLLHGALGDKAQLADLAHRLSTDFSVHVLNFGGHGGAPMPEKFTIEGFKNDVVRYLDDNQIDSAYVFGYSMGGYVALHLASSHPERVRKIFTLGTKLEWSPEIAARETRMLDASKIAEKIPAFASQLMSRHAPNDWKVVLRKTAEMMVDLGENPLTEEFFNTVSTTVRLSVGDRDTMTSLDETIAAFRQIKNASLAVLPDTQHPIEKVDADRLQRELVLFFR